MGSKPDTEGLETMIYLSFFTVYYIRNAIIACWTQLHYIAIIIIIAIIAFLIVYKFYFLSLSSGFLFIIVKKTFISLLIIWCIIPIFPFTFWILRHTKHIELKILQGGVGWIIQKYVLLSTTHKKQSLRKSPNILYYPYF